MNLFSIGKINCKQILIYIRSFYLQNEIHVNPGIHSVTDMIHVFLIQIFFGTSLILNHFNTLSYLYATFILSTLKFYHFKPIWVIVQIFKLSKFQNINFFF